MTIQAHDSDVNAVCFVDETTQILASGFISRVSFISRYGLKKYIGHAIR